MEVFEVEVNDIVARNLKTVRETKKLSLDSVAKLTGVSKSMLGQIERGEVNPTITVLWKIANGLKISFTSLLDKSCEAVQIVKKEEINPLIEADGNFINYPVFQFEENQRFEVYNIEIKPKGFLKSEPHLQGTEEYITVFSGRLNLTVNDLDYELCCGDSIRFKSDVKHAYFNTCDEVTKLNMIIYYAK